MELMVSWAAPCCRRAECPCGPKASGTLAARLWDGTLLFSDPWTLYTVGCCLFALLGVTYTRLFFVFNILDVALYFPVLRVSGWTTMGART